jgi:hypothetical protein
MTTIKELEKRVDGHEARLTMLEGLAIEAKSDRKWMIMIGGAMVSATIALSWLVYNNGTMINFIAGEHQQIALERKDK